MFGRFFSLDVCQLTNSGSCSNGGGVNLASKEEANYFPIQSTMAPVASPYFSSSFYFCSPCFCLSGGLHLHKRIRCARRSQLSPPWLPGKASAGAAASAGNHPVVLSKPAAAAVFSFLIRAFCSIFGLLPSLLIFCWFAGVSPVYKNNVFIFFNLFFGLSLNKVTPLKNANLFCGFRFCFVLFLRFEIC